MILCLDAGNSHIFGGIITDDKIILRFRHDTKQASTSDQLGLFLLNVLREKNINAHDIEKIAICSVVPNLDYSLRASCIKYFNQEPFLLQAGVKTGLKIKYRNPIEVGSDRIANAIAAVNQFPNKNIIIADLGTATTFCAISAKKEYLGGVILAGMRLSMHALQENTAKLMSVEIIKPEKILGRSTMTGIQSGLYYGQLATLKEITQTISNEAFTSNKPIILGTGGFAHLFESEGIFDVIVPDLVLHGLRLALEYNAITS